MLPPELMITIYDFCDIESQILLNLMYNFKLDKKFDWAKCKSSLTFSEEFITEYHDKLFVNYYNKIKYIKRGVKIPPKGFHSIFCWKNISKKKYLSEKFIIRFRDIIKFKNIHNYSYRFYELDYEYNNSCYNNSCHFIINDINNDFSEKFLI